MVKIYGRIYYAAVKSIIKIGAYIVRYCKIQLYFIHVRREILKSCRTKLQAQ